MKDFAFPKGALLYRSLKQNYPLISYGEGPYLYAHNGRRYFDACSGAYVSSLGHGNKEISQFVLHQMQEVAYLNGTHFTNSTLENAAFEIVSRAPASLSKVFFLCSGSEAVEAAIKLALQYWQEKGKTDKKIILSRSPSYHGNTFFGLSLSSRKIYKNFFSDYISKIPTVETPYPYRSPVEDYDSQACDYYLEKLQKKIQELGAKNIAAFVLEPVSGSSAGASAPPPKYLKRVKELCQKNNILCVADEVLVGAYRLGTFTASEQYDFQPDIMVMGKGISAGYVASSCVLCSQEIADALAEGSAKILHAQTHMQSLTVAAACLATLRYIDNYDVASKVKKNAVLFKSHLQKSLSQIKEIGWIESRGLLAGIEFVQDTQLKKSFPRRKQVAERFKSFALEQGLVLWTQSGQLQDGDGDIALLAPPLNCSESEIKECVELFAKVSKDFFNGENIDG